MRRKANPYYRGPTSDHFDGERFFVPDHRIAVKGTRELLKWRFAGGRTAWPPLVDNRPQQPPPRSVGADGLQITYIGHATVLIQAGGFNVLTDPFFSWRASPVQWAGPKRVRAPGMALAALPPIHAVLVSHNHYDHMDLPTIARLHDRDRPRILSPLGNGAILARTRRALRIEEGDWGDRISLGEGIAATFVPALHWSKRGPHDRNMALWSAFVVGTPCGAVYFAGDTGYGTGAHFRAVRADFGPMRIALLPIGAYEPRWFMHPQHMNPEEAVKAHFDLAAETSIGIHHSTVQLTDEGLDDPAEALARARQQYNVVPERFRVLEPGAGMRVSALAGDRERMLRPAAE